MVVKYVLAVAAVSGFAFSAYAQTNETEATGNGMAGDLENAIFSTTLTEANLLRINVDDVDASVWGDTLYIDSVDVDSNDVGELTDVVIGDDGTVKGYIAEVGGFLDLADKEVFLEKDAIRLVRTGEDSVDAYTNLTEEELSNLEDVVNMTDK